MPELDDDKKAALQPRTPFQEQIAAAFGHLMLGLRRSDVLVLGAPDEGLIARRAAAEGATVTVAEPEFAARETASLASRHFRIAWKTDPLADFHKVFDPGTFDLILAPHTLARTEDTGALLAQVHRLLRTDGTFALCVPHPCFAAPADGDYFAARTLRDGLAGWLPGPVTLRPLGALSTALAEAGFVPASWNDLPGDGADGTPTRRAHACLVVECGKEKW